MAFRLSGIESKSELLRLVILVSETSDIIFECYLRDGPDGRPVHGCLAVPLPPAKAVMSTHESNSTAVSKHQSVQLLPRLSSCQDIPVNRLRGAAGGAAGITEHCTGGGNWSRNAGGESALQEFDGVQNKYYKLPRG